MTLKMDMSCECQFFPQASEELLVRIDDKQKSVGKINIDFGKVAVFGHYVKKISIENLEETEILSYRIKRDAEVDEIYQVFEFHKMEGFLNVGKQNKLKITYAPKIPFQKDVDHFEFVDSGFNIINITVEGESLGPQLSTSVKLLEFTLKYPKKMCKNILEINNATEIPAEFKFDIDENEELFQVEPKQGIICKSIYITISFAPKQLGEYSQQLTCLLFGHDPLITNLFGVYTKDQNDVISKPYPFPFEETIGFGAYLKDIVNVRKIIPPVSLTKSNIDFGRLFLEKDKSNIATQATSLTNHMKKDIEVNWLEGNQVFRVYPKKVRIPPRDSALFEFCFVPTENYGIYSKTLLAQIYWSSDIKSLQPTENIINIPLSLSVNLQGTTYPDDHYLISQSKIDPSELVFPPCLPGDVAYTNFKISNLGPLTLAYKLCPPDNSNIIMKPMIGIVKQSVIVVAQLRTPRNVCRRFSERWHVILNDQESKKIPFELRGITTLPSVKLGKHNCIKFDTVQPGTHTIQSIPLRNTSHLHISFKIMSPKDVNVKLAPMEGNIAPHDSVLVTFHHTASLCSPKKKVLNCKIQAMQKMHQAIGEVYEEEFSMLTDAAYSQLCSTPRSHDFELVQWGKTIESEFSIFNLGTTTIHFHMQTSKRSHNKDIFKIAPENGSLDPGEHMTIRFEGCTKILGDNHIRIVYANRISKDSMETTFEESIELLTFSYCCTFPRLQIVEIVEHDFGPLFSKRILWTHFFNIKRLNDVLRNITSQETDTIEMHLPDFEIGSGPFYITFLVENETIFDTEINYKRKQVCDCPMKSVQSSFNSSKKVFDCPHREMLSMSINDTKFHKNSQRLLTIFAKYTIPGDTKIAYTLDIGDDRLIELLFHIHTIPADTGEISCYTKKYLAIMESIPMDRKVPPIQPFWLYNNTKISVNYKMDTSEVTNICQTEQFEIWKCINPEGEIEPYEPWPLLFKFNPIEVRLHEVIIPINFGNTTKILRILGYGVPAMRPLMETVCNMPQISMTINKFPVTLSANYLIFDILPLWSSEEQIIFINNVTKDRIMQYEWSEARIRNIVKITASPKSGVLQPKQSQTIVVKVESFNEAFITNKSLICTLTDYNQMFLHKTSLALYDKKCEELDGQFVSTEKGEQNVMKNDVILHDIPQPHSISINLSINILHDQDIRLSPDGNDHFTGWFPWSPRKDMNINISNLMKTFSNSKENFAKHYRTEKEKSEGTHEHFEFFKQILEEVIRDVTFSKTFRNLLRSSVNKVPPYYHQITMDDKLNRKTLTVPVNNDSLDKLRQDEIKKFFDKPTYTVISEVLKDIILDAIQETFKLGISYPRETDQKQMDKEVEELLKVCKDCSCKIKKM